MHGSVSSLGYTLGARGWRYAVAAVVVLSVVILMTAVRPGHSWYDDFAGYLMQAVNTAQLRPFAETLYVYDPASPTVGPRLYPPIFPLLLAPAIRVGGVDLLLLKRICVLCFAAGLVVTMWLFRRSLTEPELATYAFIVGFSPVFWDMKDYIYSEHLFVPLFYASILMMEMWYVRRSVFVSPAVHAVCLGGLIYLAYGTRTIGVVLFPTVIMCELVRVACSHISRGRPVPARQSVSEAPQSSSFEHTLPWTDRTQPWSYAVGAGALAVAAILAVLQSFAMPATSGDYVGLVSKITPRILLDNLHANSTALSLLWENGRSEWLRRIVGGGLILVGLLGYVRSNYPRPTPLGIAVGGYFVAVVLWPVVAWLRIVWPVLPAFAYYVLIGSRELAHRWRPFRFALAGVFAFTCLSYVSFYSGANYGPILDGVDSQASKDMYAFVEANAERDETVLAWKPRALALYTGRHASKLPARSPDTLLKRAREVGATLVVTRNQPDAAEAQVAQRVDTLREVFRNESWIVYRFAPSRSAQHATR